MQLRVNPDRHLVVVTRQAVAQIVAGRRRLGIGFGIHLDVGAGEGPLTTTRGWAYVSCSNTGRRPVVIERVGFNWYVGWERISHVGRKRITTMGMFRRIGQIPVEPALELAVDAPSQRIYTPLGPLLAGGLTSTWPILATATIAGGREFVGAAETLDELVPPGVAATDLTECLDRLERTAEQPPLVLDAWGGEPACALERVDSPT